MILCPPMEISYNAAVDIIERKAVELSADLQNSEECLPLTQVIGRVATRDYRAQFATPTFDSSAMDGYAVSSMYTESATEASPITMKVVGSVAAGDSQLYISNEVDNCVPPCVEIMTGARFPTSTSGPPFDSCIPIEHTKVLLCRNRSEKLIQIRNKIRPNQHRRLAGEDFHINDKIISVGETVTTHHVMALTSVGVSKIAVRKKVQIGIFSTGSEIHSQDQNVQSIADVNGPYLMTSLRSRGADVKFLGVLKDVFAEVEANIRSALCSGNFDLLISTGAVSVGKFDFIPRVLIQLGADIMFHGVTIRPGHPVLFAILPGEHRSQTPIFGLPGNPLAAAACLESLVMPYLIRFGIQRPTEPLRAMLKVRTKAASRVSPYDEFRHGLLEQHEDGWHCSLCDDQSPSKVKPFLHSNCFIHLQPGDRSETGTIVTCYPIGELRQEWQLARR